MNDDQSNPPPPVNPFAGPPEPDRSIPDALAEAGRRAWGEWREFLPHGLPLADYERYRSGSIRDAAISSATTPLKSVLPPDEVAQAAEAAADDTFEGVASLLATYEP